MGADVPAATELRRKIRESNRLKEAQKWFTKNLEDVKKMCGDGQKKKGPPPPPSSGKGKKQGRSEDNPAMRELRTQLNDLLKKSNLRTSKQDKHTVGSSAESRTPPRAPARPVSNEG